MIDKKTLFKSLTIILLLIIIVFAFIQIRNTLARYETAATTERDVDVAFWLSDDPTTFASARILIDDIYPTDTPYEYSFTVSNFDEDGEVVETDMSYHLTLTSTTNLPLKYEIQKNGTTCATFDPLDQTTSNIEQLTTDANGTQYVQLKLGTELTPYMLNTIDNTTKEKTAITDTFIIKVTFPKANTSNQEYRDLMEYIKLDLSAIQVID